MSVGRSLKLFFPASESLLPQNDPHYSHFLGFILLSLGSNVQFGVMIDDFGDININLKS
jgi:hypothetical protein